MPAPQITVSIVSHGHGALVAALLADLARLPTPVEILLTLNVPEPLPAGADRARVIRNARPKGFGANHNAAFAAAGGAHFCVMNPDVRIAADPFPALLACVAEPRIGVAAPRVLSPTGTLEDSARRFPTPLVVLRRFAGATEPLVLPERGIAHPDWVAGMFMLFRREAFAAVGGFDESYFLYYEDVDLCARLRKAGLEVAYCADASVVHDARRTSRSNARFLAWHASSVARFFWRRATGRL